jgi:hypothetical protein
MSNNLNRGMYTPKQEAGSEFGGTVSRNTIQPKGRDALTAGEELRLTYLVGDLSDTLQETPASLEDRRQMLGLKPADDARPNWLANTGKVSRAELEFEDFPDALRTQEGY